MKIFLSQTIFAGFVLAMYFAFVVLKKREWKYRENRVFVLLCLFSAIWSLGFFGVIMQTEPEKAYLWRAIGMVGTFGFLICIQYMVCFLSGIKRIYCVLVEGFSLLGSILYFFVIQKEQVTYKLSSIGMSYSFHPGIWNNLYILYTVIVAFNTGAIILFMMKKRNTQRLRELGKKLLLAEGVTVLGMLLDTVFPLFGQPAIPGSTIGQFWGLAAMYYALSFVNHSRITISNMSEYIYYSLAVPVMVCDSKGKLQILNDTGYSFLGVEREKLEGTSFESLFAISKEEIFWFEDDSYSLDTICLHNSKDCNLAINKIYDDYEDVIGYIIIATDLSERMKSMKQLEEAMRVAEDANKAKSIFLANMSHEIRTPMNAIIGFAEILLKMDISEEIRNYVRDIKSSSHNLLAIINDILDISKIESGKMELVLDNYYTATLLDDVILITEPNAQKKGLNLEVEIDREIPRQLYGDKLRIKSVLINILNNAVKYTMEGTVKFEVIVLEKDEDRVKLAFRVTDTGIGIKAENISNLFDNFERLDQRLHYGIEGSGLGLAIVKGFVNLMGGQISVSSVYGEGSVFTVEIEQAIADANPMGKADRKISENLGGYTQAGFIIQKTKVLVVDDNPVNLKVASGILSSYGLEVDAAANGQDAIALCKEHNYNIVFVDQMMPEMNGIEVMQEIRQINTFYSYQGQSIIIALTANAIKGTRESLMEQGFDEYLGKPLNIIRLESLLCQFIAAENILYKEESGQISGQASMLNYLKDIMTEVDVDLGISHCGRNVESYLKILAITYNYGEKQLNELRQLWEEKDYDTYHIKVHSLKSTALNVGAKSVSSEAKRQEQASINKDYTYIENNIEKLLSEYAKLLSKIEEVLCHFGIISEKQDEKEKPQLEEHMIKHVLWNIERHLDAFEFGEIFDILKETKKYQVPPKYEEILRQVEELMEDLSVDQVKELLQAKG
ncbi:MAG: response regulator [Lachnospiraceae bacterium]|nr:response regulator [Lachnospiraceae bacterium]